jgi:hypothetical protein
MDKGTTKINVYVVHAKFLKNRVGMYEAFLDQLKKAKLLNKVEIIMDKDPSDVQPKDVGQFTNQTVPEEPLQYFNSVLKPLKINHVSNNLKHKIALEMIAASSEFYNLVVEDDVLFVTNIIEQLKEMVKLIGDNKGVYFCGIPSPQESKLQVKKVMDFYKVLPACDSYFVDPDTAKTILTEFSRIRFAFPLQLQYTCTKNAIPLMCAAPHFLMDSSKYGSVPTSIDINNRLIFNPVFMKITELISKVPMDHVTINNLFNQFEFKSNPEYHYLKAQYEAKKKNYDIAMSMYKYAFKLYKDAGIPLTQGSQFMKDYMTLYKHFQD